MNQASILFRNIYLMALQFKWRGLLIQNEYRYYENTVTFQQDDGRPQYAQRRRQYLDTTFPGR